MSNHLSGFDFVRDQDKEIVIKLKVARATRAAYKIPDDVNTETVIVTDKLLEFPGVMYNKERRRISFKTNPDYAYAYYKITPRAIAVGTGLAIGTIAAVLAAIYLGPAVAAALGVVGSTSVAAFTVKASLIVGASAAIVSGWLINKNSPKYVFSEDPQVSKFYNELITNNTILNKGDSSLYFAFWSTDDGDPADLYKFFKTSKKVINKLPETANQIAEAGEDSLDIVNTLIKVAPFAITGWLGYKFYEGTKK